MRLTRTLQATAAAALLLAATACGSSSGSGGSSTSTGLNPPDLKAQSKLGKSEGQVNLIAWAGYVENGSNDPKVNWVSDFQKQTGCQVHSKVAASSDEMVKLMKTGEYDAVSASGDASLRLIASGDAAPVNTDLVPHYKDIFGDLKMQAWNSVKGKAYGIPHGRGANLLMYNTDKVKPAPTSWSAVFDDAAKYKGAARRSSSSTGRRSWGAWPSRTASRCRTSRRVFVDVMFPLVRSALFAGALLAFALSFDEIVVTTFTAGPGTETLPIWIFDNMTRPQQAPVVNVLAAVLVLLSVIPIYVAQRLSADTATESRI